VRSLITSGATDYLCGKCKCGLADNIDIDDLNAILASDSGSDKEAEQQEQSINQCYTCSYEAQKAHASHSLISRR
jgi:hypothetical protein